jgi:hypothetical protein
VQVFGMLSLPNWRSDDPSLPWSLLPLGHNRQAELSAGQRRQRGHREVMEVLGFEIGFWTFALVFMLFSFLLAFAELSMKAKPLTEPDYAGAYELPPGTEAFEYRDGAWRHKVSGLVATQQEVQDAGLRWIPPHKERID